MMKLIKTTFLLLLFTGPVLARLGEVERKLIFANEDTAVENEFIVAYKRRQNPKKAMGLLEKANVNSAKAKARIHEQYGNVLNGGFSFSLPSDMTPSERQEVLLEMAKDPNIAFIEQDQTVVVEEATNFWGLDRIDDVSNDRDGTYFPLNNCAAPNVRAYVIDTGIRSTHVDFGGRVDTASGYNFFDDNNDAEDCQGHGTHVAGTIGGTDSGVANDITLVPVKVFGCTGATSMSIVIKGIDYAATDCNGRDCVANMSLGGGHSSAQNQAVADAHRRGVVMVAAAGNDYGGDACGLSPASEPTAITVGSVTKYDSRSSFSNIGTCVNIFAPGSNILSASFSGDTSFTYKSGTSTASPHVAGAVACYLGANPGADPDTVAAFLDSTATVGAIANVGEGSPNKLLYIGQTDSTPPTTTQATSTTTTQPATTTTSATTTSTSTTSATQPAATTGTLGTEVAPTTPSVCSCSDFGRRRQCRGQCNGTCRWNRTSNTCAVAQPRDCSAVSCGGISKKARCQRNSCCSWSVMTKSCEPN